MREAEASYGEALEKYRALAKANPEAYLPDVAMTLNNLGLLYLDTQRLPEAEASCQEAATILEPLWQQQPEVQGNLMARIWWTLADFLPESQRPEALDLLHKALAAAYEPPLKRAIQNRIDDLSR
jgi:tetratricopeptide (TPR) repeat protein